MRLRAVRVREFKSVWDSNDFQVGDVTCLVGKNEAGKTAILQALYRLNPIIEADAKFDVTLDYPSLRLRTTSKTLKLAAARSKPRSCRPRSRSTTWRCSRPGTISAMTFSPPKT